MSKHWRLRSTVFHCIKERPTEPGDRRSWVGSTTFIRVSIYISRYIHKTYYWVRLKSRLSVVVGSPYAHLLRRQLTSTVGILEGPRKPGGRFWSLWYLLSFRRHGKDLRTGCLWHWYFFTNQKNTVIQTLTIYRFRWPC